ncbi:hypothetical protein DENSPDRAFT_465752 [Dentipellis sp. KUC8613]|nr:hypothetical protein DENSPDRAFT_465752 [Dentipellis sp. KUC8613]
MNAARNECALVRKGRGSNRRHARGPRQVPSARRGQRSVGERGLAERGARCRMEDSDMERHPEIDANPYVVEGAFIGDTRRLLPIKPRGTGLQMRTRLNRQITNQASVNHPLKGNLARKNADVSASMRPCATRRTATGEFLKRHRNAKNNPRRTCQHRST